jgi:cytoskeletal protein RodZ
MKPKTPSDREIAELIAPAFDRLPAPDARRLAAIEERLLEQPRLHGRKKIVWWWLAGALAAGAASALWWAVDYDSAIEPGEPAPAVTSPSVAPAPPAQPARPDRPADTESAPAAPPSSKPGPKIYQREH